MLVVFAESSAFVQPSKGALDVNATTVLRLRRQFVTEGLDGNGGALITAEDGDHLVARRRPFPQSGPFGGDGDPRLGVERTQPRHLAMRAKCVCHGDVNAANVVVGSHAPRAYAALLDWGGAGWADPALDFSGIALGAIPFVLAGYRDNAPLPDDTTAEARILWYSLRLALFGLRRADVTESERHHRSARLLRDTHAYLTWARLA